MSTDKKTNEHLENLIAAIMMHRRVKRAEAEKIATGLLDQLKAHEDSSPANKQ